jgi:DNA-binding response OmpR family regulator
VPVVVVTGLYKGPQYRHEAIATFGASDYFEKPVDPDRFTETIRLLMRDEEEIEEVLPDPETVIDNLSQRLRENAAREKEEDE